MTINTSSDFNAARLGIGEPDRAWPPPLEAYCPECRRMVAARPWGGTGALIPVRHFRSDISGQHDSIACWGTYTPDRGRMSPGMEDPVAAFYIDPKARTRALYPPDKRKGMAALWSK